MVFSSVVFLFYFLPAFIIVYYVAPAKARNTVLLAASLFFYAYGEPVYIILMIVSIIVNYTAGICLVKSGRKKIILVSAVLFNVCLLAVFKYSGQDIPLPIGISFYTFQAMSYIADLYRGEIRLQRNIIDFAAYISMFPQLIAGPIVRIRDVECSLEKRSLSIEKFSYGVKRFTIGLGKKVLLANNAGFLWDSILSLPEADMTVMTAWIGILAFTFQIYFDFSGYSDMAIGLGKITGFDFPENFEHPYMSVSVTEFWRRWHISLGTWFREYVYIPLGGNRRSFARNMFNIFAVWFLTGLWHGASMNFVVWGLYFGVLLVCEKFLKKKFAFRIPPLIGHIYTMFFVVISWVIFSIEDMQGIMNYIGYMFGSGGTGFINSTAEYIISNNTALFAILVSGCTDIPERIYQLFNKKAENDKKLSVIKVIADNIFILAVLILSIAYIVSSSYNPFLYFRF